MADNPRITIRCEYPDTDMPPTEVTFGLSPHYGPESGRKCAGSTTLAATRRAS